MNYLAIKGTNGKGVYQYNTRDERSSILKSLGLGKNAGKVFTNKSEALEYAKVKEVANRAQQVVTDSNKSNNNTKNTKTTVTESNTALSMLNNCKEKGFDFATITLTNGFSFDVVLRDFSYLSYFGIISEHGQVCSTYVDNEYTRYIEPYGVECYRYSFNNFNEYKTKITSIIESYNNELARYDHVIKFTLKDALNYIQQYFDNQQSSYDPYVKIINSLKSTKIESTANFLFFDKISILNFSQYTNDYGRKRYIYEDLDKTTKNNYILNTDYILSITPKKSAWKITDTEFLNFNR